MTPIDLDAITAPIRESISKITEPVAQQLDEVSGKAMVASKDIVDQVKHAQEEGTPLRGVICTCRESLNDILFGIKVQRAVAEKEMQSQLDTISSQTAWVRQELSIVNDHRRRYPWIFIGTAALVFAAPPLFRRRYLSVLRNGVIGGGGGFLGVKYLEIQDKKN